MPRPFVFYVVFVLGVSVTPASAVANTISEAYSEAFANPVEFEEYLVLEVDDSFYGKFAKCSKLADPALAGVEKNLKARYAQCQDNSECADIAKQISVVAEARQNVRAMTVYLAAESTGKGGDFDKSEAGQRAFAGFNIIKKVTGITDNRQVTALIRATPYFTGLLAILATLPCE